MAVDFSAVSWQAHPQYSEGAAWVAHSDAVDRVVRLIAAHSDMSPALWNESLRPFTLEPCPYNPFCLRDQSESKKCCNVGRCILGPQTMPIWSLDYMNAFQAIPFSSSGSYAANAVVAFASVGVSSDHPDGSGFRNWYLPGAGPHFFSLHGRVTHATRSTMHQYHVYPGRHGGETQMLVNFLENFLASNNRWAAKFSPVT